MHPDQEVLFREISFSLDKGEKVSLVGKNGTGKSTLLRIIGGMLPPTSGVVHRDTLPYYVPQHFGQYDALTVGEALGVAAKIAALQSILAGEVSEVHFDVLGDDWEVEERVREALADWRLSFRLEDSLERLSGGEKTRLFLAGIAVHRPDFVLLDEPSNHLDLTGREQLYDWLRRTECGVLVVSHDRRLLEIPAVTLELERERVVRYGGNYSFYKTERDGRLSAQLAKIEEGEKALRKAHRVARQAAERKQRQDARGKEKLQREGVPRIAMGNIRNKAEQTASKTKEVHTEKIGRIAEELRSEKEGLPDRKRLRVNVENASLPSGKLLLRAEGVNVSWGEEPLWPEPLSFEIRSGERICLKGDNGSGKTTLIRLITGQLEPTAGSIVRYGRPALYLDQEYSLIDNHKTVRQQLADSNEQGLPEHELNTLLHRHLFPQATWNQRCGELSGGEKMRLLFCCLTVYDRAPDLFILDEPTNNLDIDSLEIVSSALQEYRGTLLVVSHDTTFLEEIGVNRELGLLLQNGRCLSDIVKTF